MDISPEMLKEVQMKMEKNNIINIETVLTEENDLKIENHKVSIAYISFVLHEAEHKEKFLKEVKRIISSKGRIAIIEWKKSDGEFGPPLDHRLDEVVSVGLLSNAGFINISSININENFYALIGEMN
ncbi:MAG: class I SAM-dependent methyltransferase [Clostridium sp.]|uniref:class I SAM-dependent methyltransferase n=1 Tax=Clostridium sp. TaxID=1506 RepID=UPI0039EC9897